MKNKKGFTLVELVVAIAALALCSGLILSVFIASDDLSVDASIYDEAMNHSSNIAESFKASYDIENFLNNALPETDYIIREENDNSDGWTYYYDKDWNFEKDEDTADIVMKIELIEDTLYESGTLYKIKIDFSRISNEDNENILELIAMKYYRGGAR